MKTENKFMFTNDSVRKLKSTGRIQDHYYDAGCKGLAIRITPVENRATYVIMTPKGGYAGGVRTKNIGNVYQITLEKAREIARNIMENVEEYHNTPVKKNEPLFIDFEKNGFYPRKNREITQDNPIVLMENAALKEKIQEYARENNELHAENQCFRRALKTLNLIVTQLNEACKEVEDE